MSAASSRLLRQGLVRSVLAANAYRPRFRHRALTIPSFFAGWLTSEAAPLVLGAWGLRTAKELRRREGPLGPADLLGIGLSGAAAIGVAGLIREGVRAGEQLDAALATEVPEAELAQAPRALRAGAVLPVLMGNRRRSITRNIAYATPDGHRLRLDVYEPLTDPLPGERRPAVVQIHGGGWVIGSKDEQGIPLLNHLASCGWVGFNVDYRLSPKVRYPTHLEDCKRALAWVREHAEEFSVDPNFIVVTGGSAGG
ncbi:MAG: alpha/beta hydrolase, partial [Actinomycetes bacterium]